MKANSSSKTGNTNSISNRKKEISERMLREADILSIVGNKLLLIGDAIIVATNNPIAVLHAASIKLIGGFILTQSTIIAVNQNRISDDPIPEQLNTLKFIGSALSIVGSVISTKALFDETAIRNVDSPVVPPFGFINN